MISKHCYGYMKASWQDTWKKNVPSSRSGLNRHFYILYSVLSLSVIEDVEAGTTKVRLKNLSQQHLHFFKFDVEVFHFNPQKKEEKFVIFLLFFVRNFIRTRTDGGGDISSTHFVLFWTTCSHCAQSFCCKWGGTSTKKKKKALHKSFFGKRIIDPAGRALWWSSAVSDQCQQRPLTRGASSKLLQYRLLPPIEATVSVLISCDARAAALFQPLLLFTFFFPSLYKFSSVGELSTLASLIFGCRGCRSRSSFGSNRWTPCCHIIMKPQILYRAPLVCLLLFGSYENVLSLIRLSSKRHFLPHILPIISHSEQNGRACARLRVRLREHLQKFHLSSCFAAEFHIAHYK